MTNFLPNFLLKFMSIIFIGLIIVKNIIYTLLYIL